MGVKSDSLLIGPFQTRILIGCFKNKQTKKVGLNFFINFLCSVPIRFDPIKVLESGKMILTTFLVSFSKEIPMSSRRMVQYRQLHLVVHADIGFVVPGSISVRSGPRKRHHHRRLVEACQ